MSCFPKFGIIFSGILTLLLGVASILYSIYLSNIREFNVDNIEEIVNPDRKFLLALTILGNLFTLLISKELY